MRRIIIDYQQIIYALDATGGHKSAAAARLGVSPATLRRRMKEEHIGRYAWQPNLRRRLVTETDGDTIIDGYVFDRPRPLLKMWKELLRGEGINEPRRLSKRELKALYARWRGKPRYQSP